MEHHTIVTITFGVCFTVTAIIALPISFIGYIAASITVVVHYLFAQLLIGYIEKPRRRCDVYMLFASICIVAAIIWAILSDSHHKQNEVEAALGFFIPSVVGSLIDLSFVIHMKLWNQSYV